MKKMRVFNSKTVLLFSALVLAAFAKSEAWAQFRTSSTTSTTSTTTTRTYCGDGVVSGTEACDDGNTVDGDGCSSTCMIEAIRLSTGTTSTTGTISTISTTTTTATKEFCGDGVVSGTEACDDGNTVNGDGCSSTCTIEPVRTSTGTTSTIGTISTISTTTTDPTIVATDICGNGNKVEPEECDDGNTVDGDGCSSRCTIETSRTTSTTTTVNRCDGFDPAKDYDNNPCTVSQCDPATGAITSVAGNDGASCNDGDACTTGDYCVGGRCAPRQKVTRDDGNVCTRDSCDLLSGVKNEPISGCCTTDIQCDDKSACTADRCDTTTHTCANQTVSVDDRDACTTDSCNSASGPVYTKINVDDRNACTTDSCDPATGKVSNTPIPGCCASDAQCDDRTACTADSCDLTANKCVNKAVSVDDRDLCTTDSCDPASGPVHTKTNVDDRNACTTDSCDPATGKVSNTPIPGCCASDAQCDDRTACTSDSCDLTANKCVNKAVSVDDRDLCTTDSCDPASGPVHTKTNPDDRNACTTDSCDPATGRVSHITIQGCCTSDAECNDGNACTKESCDLSSGRCLSSTIEAPDDGLACTEDTCDPRTGPVHTAKNIDDGNPCTVDRCSEKEGITHELNLEKDFQCTGTEPGCDPATCRWQVPQCKVLCDPAVTVGEIAHCKVGTVYGTEFTCWTAPHQENTTTDPTSGAGTAVPVNSFTGVTLSASEGAYDTPPLSGPTDVSCTAKGQGGESQPCIFTVETSECIVSCKQPSGEAKTVVGTDADCRLTDRPESSSCRFTSMDGDSGDGSSGEISVFDTQGAGLIDIDTSYSHTAQFEVTCSGGSKPKAVCRDTIQIAPICKNIEVSVSGQDGETRQAHVGETVALSINGTGFKDCTLKVNETSTTYAAEPIRFKAEEPQYILSAVCTGGDGLTAECPGRRIFVAEPSCGNEIVEANEQCDDGNEDVTDACIRCQHHEPVCGDGILHKILGEECDEGKNNGAVGVRCNPDCRIPHCGDHHLQTWLGESCEPKDAAGNVDSNCDPTLCIPLCGNGREDPGETCDPETAYTSPTRTCDVNSKCTAFNPYCGDGKINSTVEECDGGTDCSAECRKIPPPTPERTPEPTLEKEPETPQTTLTETTTDKTPPPPVKIAFLPPPPPVAAKEKPEELKEEETDLCLLEKGPKESRAYQCCRAATTGASIAEDLSECCLDNVVPVRPDGKYSTEERQTCSCHHEPNHASCFSCYGRPLLDRLAACSGAKVNYDKIPGKAVLDLSVGSVTRETTFNLCSCPNPQTAAPSACGESLLTDPLGFACYHQENTEDLKKMGYEAAVDGNTLTIGGNFSEKECLAKGGQPAAATPAPETKPSENPEDEEGSLEAEMEPAKTEPAKDEKKAFSCMIKRPLCICDAPESAAGGPTTVMPSSPPASTTPSEGSLAMCRGGDDEAVLLSSGKTVPLKEPCQTLSFSVVTSPTMQEIYRDLAAYYKNRGPGDLEKARATLAKHLANDAPEAGILHDSMAVMTLSKDKDGQATITPMSPGVAREYYAVKRFVELNPMNGNLVVKNSEAAARHLPPVMGNASDKTDTGSQLVSAGEMFKTMETQTAGGPQNLDLVVVDFGAGSGGGGLGGCALASEKEASTVPLWTLAAGILTLMSWRYRRRRLRASMKFCRNTPVRESFTKN